MAVDKRDHCHPGDVLVADTLDVLARHLPPAEAADARGSAGA